MKYLKTVYYNHKTGRIGDFYIEPTLEKYYEALYCDLIDIVIRAVGGKKYAFIVDDEGLLEERPIASAIDPRNLSNSLVGSLLVAGLPDEDGELTSLTDEDIINIMGHVLGFYDPVEKIYRHLIEMDQKGEEDD